MQSRLIVKNFGPIKYVDLDLRNVNVFIGPQASGKSALAKLFTICKAPRKFLRNGESDNVKAFLEVLDEYNIGSFLKSDTEISFESEVHKLSYSEKQLQYEPKLKNEVDELSTWLNRYQQSPTFEYDLRKNIQSLQERYDTITPKWFEIGDTESKENRFAHYSQIVNSLVELETYLSSQAAAYIPSERSFFNIIKGNVFNLSLNNVPIPKYILLLGAEIEKAKLQELDLGFLQENLTYKRLNGEDRIFFDSANSIQLIEAASGIQSAVNILIPVHSQNKELFHRSFVIEEPELNLFPSAQYELIKILESLRKEAYFQDTGSIHTYTTHSPYILSSFNNLLYASKVWNKYGSPTSENYVLGVDQKLQAIIPANSNIQPTNFTAYQIYNGRATSIFNREIGLIEDNFIDESSDKMADDFDALMELMK